MQHIAWLLFTITAAIIGSWIGLRIGIPAGALIGAICSVGLLQILTECSGAVKYHRKTLSN